MGRAGAVVALVGALASASCDESIRDIAGPTPDLVPTLASIQQQIFTNRDSAGRSACTDCHQGPFAPQGLRFTGDVYDALVNRQSTQRRDLMIVRPGDPDNSYLIHKLEGRPGILGTRMPPVGPPLTEGQMLIIRNWIASGAPR
jgi:hypothetical protein